MVSADLAVQRWPKWAWTSDLLFAPHLLQHGEVELHLATLFGQFKLPKGVTRHEERFKVTHQGKVVGWFQTLDDAVKGKQQRVDAVWKEAWQKHLSIPISRDEQDRAIIMLSGAGKGQYSIVPAKWWHELTFQTSWGLAKQYASGRWHGKSCRLHNVIAGMMFGVYDKKYTVDHIISSQKLNNGEDILRLATQSLHMHNRGVGRHDAVKCITKQYNRWRA